MSAQTVLVGRDAVRAAAGKRPRSKNGTSIFHDPDLKRKYKRDKMREYRLSEPKNFRVQDVRSARVYVATLGVFPGTEWRRVAAKYLGEHSAGA